MILPLPILHANHHLVLAMWLHSEDIIGIGEVKLDNYLSQIEVVEYGGDQWEIMSIYPGCCIEISVVHPQPQALVLLLHKQDCCNHR